MVLARDRERCRECDEPGDRRGLDVHHLVRRADGGRDEASNCITLCDGCHAARHPRLQVALSRRMMQRWALRLAHWLDRTGELPDETRALDGALALFGVERFRDGQLEAVLGALRGESLLVIRPTGAGKSLCFQLPAVLKGQPATFVLSPLKALMVDQVDGLQRRKLPATFINGDIAQDEKEERYRLLESGALSLLYVAPERFNPKRVHPKEVQRLARQRPNFLVVDEAHLVDRWGDDFRTDYSRIADIRQLLSHPPVLAFTATAGARTQQRISWQHPAAIEDYLQEFGRGGRDGHPALALLFGDGGRESGLLRWMADKTAESVVANNERTHVEAQNTLRGKKDRIDEMSRLTRQTNRCFRAELNEALTGQADRPRRSWPLRILDWAFSSHSRVHKADACCDICNPELVKQLRAGAYAPRARRTFTGHKS